jgi:hypothetical protein
MSPGVGNRFQARRARMTPRNDRVLSRKTDAVPLQTTISPARAGPTARETLIESPFKATAACSSARGTSS